jgi:hypothetical protein
MVEIDNLKLVLIQPLSFSRKSGQGSKKTILEYKSVVLRVPLGFFIIFYLKRIPLFSNT